MSEHTPGPWGYEASGVEGVDRFYEIAPFTEDGALDWGCEVASTASNNEADARLITAAPDLLEACMELLVSITEFGMGNGHDACCITQAIPFDPCDCGAEKARAAIAKARGAS